MLVAENVEIVAPMELSVRVTGRAAVSFRGCKMDCGEGGLLVTELSAATLQSCTLDAGAAVAPSHGSAAGTVGAQAGPSMSRHRTGIMVSFGGQLTAQDLTLTGATDAGVLVAGTGSSAELHSCRVVMHADEDLLSVADGIPLKVTSKGSLALTNCLTKGGLGGIQARLSCQETTNLQPYRTPSLDDVHQCLTSLSVATITPKTERPRQHRMKSNLDECRWWTGAWWRLVQCSRTSRWQRLVS